MDCVRRKKKFSSGLYTTEPFAELKEWAGVCGVCVGIHSAGVFADAACGVHFCDRGERDAEDLLRCPHYHL